MSMVKHFKELRVYWEAFTAAMKIFNTSKGWPNEERYSLTDQIRRSSRSVCANIAEAWRKRRYVAHFRGKLSDADSETAETQSWLDFALESGYITQAEHAEMDRIYETISGGLVKMMDSAENWCGPAGLVKENREEYGSEDAGKAWDETPILPNTHTLPTSQE